MILETSRLRLIPAAQELAGQVCDYYCRNREFLTPYDPLREAIFFTEDYHRLLLSRMRPWPSADAGTGFISVWQRLQTGWLGL